MVMMMMLGTNTKLKFVDFQIAYLIYMVHENICDWILDKTTKAIRHL